MKTLFRFAGLHAALLMAGVLTPWSASAQLVVKDNFTGASSAFNWQALNGACLTAGNGSGTIPACVGLSYYTAKNSLLVGGTTGRLPDVAGSGALRLTNGDTTTGSNGDYEIGAIVSNFTFPTYQGLQVTFTTVTYGGDNYGGHGADGITFYLMDGANNPSVGASGGSLGYSCSNGNPVFDGVHGGYIGLGIDEFGNYSNKDDNTDTGPGDGVQPGRITLRGAGDTNYASLSANYPQFYPAGVGADTQKTAIWNTCKTGYLWNYSGSKKTDANGKSIAASSQTTQRVPFNYPYITHRNFGVAIASQEATNLPKRGAATPITYSLKLSQDGYLDLSYSINGGTAQTVLTQQKITDSNGPLPGTFRFGFSSGTGGGSNVHEITCFKAAPANLASDSAGSNVQQTGQLLTGTQAYFAYYHPVNSWGELAAYGLTSDGNGNLSINAQANWNGSCSLTGGACQSMGASASLTAQAPTDRAILSWSGSAGIPFQWSSLSSAQQGALAAASRLSYLRGDRTGEVSNSGSYRNRTGVLGDIIDSSPTWVGPPSSPYPDSFVDALTQAKGSESAYSSFRSGSLTRANVVYVGANDGMLHGFRAGAYGSDGNYAGTSSNDGRELLAYMPASALTTIYSTTAALDFSSTLYGHNYFVDGTPGSGDLYYAGKWHTWLVSGLGVGGNAAGPVSDTTTVAAGSLFALDITDPSLFSEANAASLVVGDWSSASLSCNGTACGQYLGAQTGTPLVRRTHDGNWALIFGNGLNSSNGTAGIYVMTVSKTDGSKTLRFLSTGSTSTSPRNGIAQVAAVDLDNDHIVDYVYAGDALGQVWRFDLTSSSASSWGSATKLFTTPNNQPITTRLAIAAIPSAGASGLPRVMVSFGTGRRFPQTQTSSATYASGTQSLYGIWDWNMAAWNTLAATTSGYTYASLAAPQSITASSLQSQSVLTTLAAGASTPSLRTVSRFTVCWKDQASCNVAGVTPEYGWRMDLPGSSEQVIYDPSIVSGLFVVNTTIPGVTQALSCSDQATTGYTMAIDIGSGGAPSQSVFSTDGVNFGSTANGEVVAGAALNATGRMTTVLADGRQSFLYQTTDGSGGTSRFNVSGLTGSRVTWRKLK